MRSLSLRLRLTLAITIVFAAMITVTAVIGMRAVRRELLADTRTNAEEILRSTINTSDPIVGGEPSAGTSAFFYLDADGNEITPDQFTAALGLEALAAGLTQADTDQIVTASSMPLGDCPLANCDEIAYKVVAVDGANGSADSGESFVPPGSVAADPSLPPYVVERDPNMVSVVQPLNVDGQTLGLGFSVPLRPVTDSLDAMRSLLWFAVPALVALIAAITWFVVGRALRPVHAISSQVRSITATNIDDRVPVGASNDEISELATTMNDMLGRLQTAQERQRQLVSDASHELRSPVAASRAQLEVAIAHPDLVDWRTTGRLVLAEQERLAQLIDDLLELGRLEEQPDHLSEATEVIDVDLDEVVLDDARRPRRVPVLTTISEPVRLRGDAAMLTRIVRNLIDNAARHATSEVHVTVGTNDGKAVIHVDDDGAGVGPGQRDRIFERFTRLDEARDRSSGGAGLGLAIARGSARAYHGDVTVTESPSGGARFTVTLPIDNAWTGLTDDTTAAHLADESGGEAWSEHVASATLVDDRPQKHPHHES